MKALILFSSTDGQTEAIANVIADELKETQVCDVVNIDDADKVELTQYTKILLGASVRYGHFAPALDQFIQRNLALLQNKPSAFFSVNLTARKPEKSTVQTNAYTRKFLMRCPWKPDLGAVFAGALRYPRYRWFDRIMIKLIMRMTGGETDTSREIEYTDWHQVRDFAQQFGQLTLKKKAQ
ncbi:menaquinone-dependent protoporphyrinogen IX dehydrogenase [Lonsdalea quercina]|uniref:menaquinone-dependent protoporphyrinogen IX dehydrogenase n=1 Tax=Lonsdalea quercina TaxID=71657 RepID=UPI003976ADD3